MAGDSGMSGESAPEGVTLTIILVFLSIAMYNFFELIFIIFATFKKQSGLYFWSFIISTAGILPYSVGFLLKALSYRSLNWVYVTLIVVGWVSTVTGQSVVLYSRLHIVVRNTKLLRGILTLIITNAIVCHLPTSVLVYGSNSSNPHPFIKPYSIYERVEVTLFFIQEVFLSCVYIVETIRFVRRREDMENNRGKHRRTIMIHLVAVNVIVIILDVTLLALQYSGLYDIQTAYKAVVYSIKLKVEFSILNKLVQIVTGSSHGSSFSNERSLGGGVHMGRIGASNRGKMGTTSRVGNSTYVGTRSKDDNAVTEHSAAPGPSVMMTREIIIHREEISSSSDGDSDTATAKDINRAGTTSRCEGGKIDLKPSSESVERLTDLSY